VLARRILGALILVLVLGVPASAREPVSGLVVGPAGPLAGVRVQAVETGENALTGEDGRFRLELAAPGPATLRFSLAGYKSLTRRMDEAATDVIVSMKPLR
jgi:hypothetical protein